MRERVCTVVYACYTDSYYDHQALEHIVYYVVLAPHDNEQSDMLHRLFIDPALPRLELH